MHLDKLEVKGFKSFRDKTTIEFPDDFTAIVGPNGSGKSNLTEAICFVLGKSRGLRANNLQELIFNGGKHDKPAKKAIVSIDLSDNGKRHRISRMVDIDGHSVYKVDGKRASRQRVVDLLGDNDYNIILQDDVTKVIKMQPRERRQIIDELCGIAEYDKKKGKALNELEKVEDRISDTEIVLGEKQGYMLRLRKERDDALAYKEIRDEIKQNNAGLINHDMVRLEKRRTTLDSRVGDLESQKKEKTDGIGKIRVDIEDTRQQLKDCNKSIIDLEEDSNRSKINELNSQIIRHEERISALDEKKDDFYRNQGENARKKSELKGELKKRQTSLSEVKKSINDLESIIEQTVTDSADGVFETEIDALKDSVYGSESEIRSLEKIRERLVSELEGLHKNELTSKDELSTVVTGRSELSDGLSEKTVDLSKKSDELETLKHNIKKLGEMIDKLKAEYNGKNLVFSEKKTDLKVLEESGGGLRGSEKAIMKLKDVIPGIYGPLSQLGNIRSKEYEKALIVASGYRMNFIIVKNVDSAKKCIEYLKKKKIGRSTFLPLDKINFNVGKDVPKGSIGLARDYVEVDAKFEKILEYVFGDTIIVEDISSAKSIGIGKHRMVTLDGELFEKSGVISGGFMKKEYMITFSNLDDLEDEIKKLGEGVNRLNDDIGNKTVDYKKFEENIGELVETINEAKIVVERLRSDLNSKTTKEKELADYLKNISNSILRLENELDDNSKRSGQHKSKLSAERDRLTSALEKREPGKTEYDKLKENNMQLSLESSRLIDQSAVIKSQIDDLIADDNRIKSEISGIVDEGESLKKALKSLRGELSKIEVEGATIVDKIRTLMNRRNDLDNAITEFGSKIGELEHGLYGINDKISSVLVEKTKVETELNVKKQEFEKYEDVELLDKKVSEMNGTIMKLENRLEDFGPINMKAIESYDIVKNGYDDIVGRLNTLKKERQSIFDFMEDVEKKKYNVFIKTFDIVRENFEDIFKSLADGQGTLILDNPGNISESGLMISASPGGKKIMSLDAMSGGEKVITTSAFLLALQRYKPAYFYIVDELDAALDKVNSIRLGELLRDSKAQFILVTHNNSMIKYADSVVGVSMTKGISKIIGVKLEVEPAA